MNETAGNQPGTSDSWVSTVGAVGADGTDSTPTSPQEPETTATTLRRQIAYLRTRITMLSAELDTFRSPCPKCGFRVLSDEACLCELTPRRPAAPLASFDLGPLAQEPADAANATDATAECKHGRVRPTFDEGAAHGLSVGEVRRRWPRFDGTCPDCDAAVTLYESTAHYVYGDW